MERKTLRTRKEDVMISKILIFVFMVWMLPTSWATAEENNLSPDSSATQQNAQPEGNQQFQGFNLQGYTDGGQKAWDVNGDKADIVGDTISITNVDANQYSEQQLNLKAKTGVVNKATGSIHLAQDVVITSKDGSQFKTDTLQWERDQDLVTTDDPITVTTEKGMSATGTGLVAKPSLGTAQVKKDVTVKVETQPDKPAGGNSELTITSDGPMEIDQKNNKATFTKNVVASQEGRTLNSDRMEVYFDAETQKIKRLVCLGNVVIMQGENSSTSDTAIYTAGDQKLVLTGRPKLILMTQGGEGLASFKK